MIDVLTRQWLPVLSMAVPTYIHSPPLLLPVDDASFYCVCGVPQHFWNDVTGCPATFHVTATVNASGACVQTTQAYTNVGLPSAPAVAAVQWAPSTNSSRRIVLWSTTDGLFTAYLPGHAATPACPTHTPPPSFQPLQWSPVASLTRRGAPQVHPL